MKTPLSSSASAQLDISGNFAQLCSHYRLTTSINLLRRKLDQFNLPTVQKPVDFSSIKKRAKIGSN